MSISSKELLYKKADDYWSHIPATLDGVLGGFGFISGIDIEGSKKFLKSIFCFENPPSPDVALDCGAGIGRVSKYLLMPIFGKVDLVEQDKKFLKSVKEFVGSDNENKLGSLYNVGLQQFTPDKKYDVIWNQWVLGHLDDEDLISYLGRCRQ
ncbi:Alpha N-terminal protein methyltransferase 1 [Eumeta japonica]|uniref:Alpha N-terminal protein methyltransferase 1 n=1 Tax=Eumeta variegata TaxID=151549 RepID=A0A4C1ZUG2_EUMVA|nr:Alpha N-terminal protein methyltransferase 1 [Eumeta japonica]